MPLGPRMIFLGRPKRRLHLLIIRKSQNYHPSQRYSSRFWAKRYENQHPRVYPSLSPGATLLTRSRGMLAHLLLSLPPRTTPLTYYRGPGAGVLFLAILHFNTGDFTDRWRYYYLDYGRYYYLDRWQYNMLGGSGCLFIYPFYRKRYDCTAWQSETVNVFAIPEPSTIAFLGLGGLAILGTRRKAPVRTSLSNC